MATSLSTISHRVDDRLHSSHPKLISSKSFAAQRILALGYGLPSTAGQPIREVDDELEDQAVRQALTSERGHWGIGRVVRVDRRRTAFVRKLLPRTGIDENDAIPGEVRSGPMVLSMSLPERNIRSRCCHSGACASASGLVAQSLDIILRRPREGSRSHQPSFVARRLNHGRMQRPPSILKVSPVR